MDQKYTNDTVLLLYYKELDKSYAWLTQKTEESKCYKGKRVA